MRKASLLKSALNDLNASAPIKGPLSKFDSVQNGQGLNLTVSKMDTVQNNHCPNQTVSKIDPVTKGYTKVPNDILRKPHFREPLDFMIYMFLFSRSYGFQKSTAHVAQSEIMRFTGTARNTIKRAMERLASQGLIRLKQDYRNMGERRVYEIKLLEGDQYPELTVSNLDTVQNEPTPVSKIDSEVSNLDQGRVSNLDSIKESIKRNINTLSQESASGIFEYLNSLTKTKREREEAALEELLEKHTLENIECCYQYLKAKGAPVGGEPVHSPMVFLLSSMDSVLPLANAWASEQINQRHDFEHKQERDRAAILAKNQQELDYQQAERLWTEKFPTPAEQEAEILRYLETEFPMGKPPVKMGRRLTITSLRMIRDKA